MNDVRKWIAPPLVAVLALLVFTTMFFPTVRMEPRDLPIAVVNLDEGASGQEGEVNFGDEAIEGFSAQAEASGMFEITVLETQEELEKGLSNNEYYAAIVIPADFTMVSNVVRQGTGETPVMTLIVNQGKHPMAANMVDTALSNLGAGGDVGLSFEKQYHNAIPAGLGQTAMFIPILMLMFSLIPSIVGARITTNAIKFGDRDREKTLLSQLLAITAASMAIGLVGAGAIKWLIEIDLSYWHIVMFEFVAALMFGVLVLAALNWLGMAGIVIPVFMMVLGMATANLPYEFLPSLWQDWIYPWIPPRFVADGARALLFQGAGWWSSSLTMMIIIAAVSLIGMFAAIYKPRDGEFGA